MRYTVVRGIVIVKVGIVMMVVVVNSSSSDGYSDCDDGISFSNNVIHDSNGSADGSYNIEL